MEPFPFVSVIMPIRNEAAFIEESLSAILRQDYPHDKIEILIADGMSTDNTREIIAHVIANQDIDVKVLDNPDKIVPFGMNRAIQQAKGDVIVRVDGHAVIRPDYIRKCIEGLRTTRVDCVGGVIESVGKGYIGETIAIAMGSPFGVGNAKFRTASENSKPVLTDTLAFGAYRKEVFKQVGLFKEQWARHQDYEFNYRLRKAGGCILLFPSARVKYYVRLSLRKLWEQYWQYGFWKGRFLRKNSDSIRFRHLGPPIFVFTFILCGILPLISKMDYVPLSVLMGTYACFVVIALISMLGKVKVKYYPLLPVIFAILHFSWGLGVWAGLILGQRNLTVNPEKYHQRNSQDSG